MKKMLSGIMIFLLIILFVPKTLSSSHLGAAEQEGSSDSANEWYELGAFRDSTYYRTVKRWQEEGYNPVELQDEISFDVLDSKDLASNVANEIVYDSDDDYHYAQIEKGQSLDVIINVDEAGLYELGLVFKAEEEFKNEPFISLKIKDVEPFNELSNIALDVTWNLKKLENFDKNRYGNELLPDARSNDVWYSQYLTDNNSRYVSPFKILLEKGDNKVTIKNIANPIKIAKVLVGYTPENISYEEYTELYSDTNKYQKIYKELITIDSEKIASKNDIEIKAGYYKDPSMSPNAYKNTVLNTLDGASSSRGGSRATYNFEVEKAGLYKLSVKYLQNTLAGLSCAKTIYIDGKVPFKEFETYLFPENRKWSNHTLKVDGEPVYIYLEEGTHSISFETTTAQYTDLIEELYAVMDKINTLGLTVASITGSSTSSFTDWNIVKYLPTMVDDLYSYADRIDAVYDAINDMTPSKKEASEVSTLQIASKQLRRLTKKPNKIHLKLSELNSGSGSAYGLIGTAIGTLLNQPVSFDSFYFSGESTTLPKANSSLFTRIFFSIKSFFYSFVDDRYKLSSRENDVLEVWVAQSNLYLDIIQSMADQEFTMRGKGPEVKINILPSSQKLILNNATNSNPDVVLSIDSWEPYNYALRGMLEDLSKYEGFDDITKNIYANCFTPVIYNEGVYAIPETTGLNVLFYRKDIFEYLDLEAPKTWDDVIKILPILQSYQMNFFHPLGSDSSYKSYSATTPFIYGFGGEVFTEDGLTTVLTNENVIAGIQYMTDLFNIYNLPRQVSSFYEHFRSGTIPIGVGTVDMYLQLKYASPELSGQWDICPVPGFDIDNNGEIESWTTAYGKSSILFESSQMKEEGWAFIKWWNSTETQIKYLQNIKMCLGEKYLIIPANMEALEQSPWEQQIKEEVTKAAKWSRIPAIIPGSYIVEREFSNIWNNVVINGMDVRVAVGKSVDVVNRELLRKFEEFNLVDTDGNSKYVVPSNNNINNWVKGREYYEEEKQ